jgi:hypothetical protein
VPYESVNGQLSGTVRWPGLGERVVVIGGVRVRFREAEQAIAVLAGSRTSAIAPVLKAAGSPLAVCDYFAAATPYLAAARSAPKTGRIGAAGRHVTKNAFIDAVNTALAEARSAELAAAIAAFRTDERYAVLIAREAVAVRVRAHAAGYRSAVQSAAARATAACAALTGQFTCSAATACGTGSCRFAPAEYRQVTVPATAGRFPRPANHVVAGSGFDGSTAAAELADLVPYRVGVLVRDYDEGHARDEAA